MTKSEFLERLATLYRVGNAADSSERADWTHPEMAGPAFCAAIDRALGNMVDCGVLTDDEHCEWLNTI